MFGKLNESEMLSRFQSGVVLLPPLVVRASVFEESDRGNRVDARIRLALPDSTEEFRFVVESKAKSTPQTVLLAVAQAKKLAREGEWPMIQVPYLSPERLDELERDGVSGVDLCGNGVIIVPGRLYVLRSGQPNRYPDSRLLSNAYRGRSAMVARMLAVQPRWESLTALAVAIQKGGAELSTSQVSKAAQTLEEELIVSKAGGGIQLTDPLRLLDNLGREWRKNRIRSRQALRLPSGIDLAPVLSSNPLLKWAVTGESSVMRYTQFSQGGPLRVAVSSLPLAQTLLRGEPETVPSFADLELIETEETGYFFANEIDEKGIRWASRLQTWLELQAGDARQQDAAQDIRNQILKEARF